MGTEPPAGSGPADDPQLLPTRADHPVSRSGQTDRGPSAGTSDLHRRTADQWNRPLANSLWSAGDGSYRLRRSQLARRAMASPPRREWMVSSRNLRAVDRLTANEHRHSGSLPTH